MKKKILAFILLAALLINALPAYAAPAPTFRVETVTAEAGETVQVTIWIENNPGVGNIVMQVGYDDALTLKKVTFNSELEGLSSAKKLENPVTLNWMWMDFDMERGVYNLFGDMAFATLTFEVAADATAGTYPVAISYEAEDVYFNEENGDYSDVTFDTIEGGVEIEGQAVAVTGVSLDKETLSLTEGESAQLTAVVAPAEAENKAVTFTSSDSAVASVDANGKVTAVKAGSATITVTTADGGFTATCAVTVNCGHTNKTETAATESTCATQGWDAYESCDDCGQLFDESHNEIDEIPFRPLSGTHTGGTATCTELAVCTACGTAYGAYGEHNYTAQEKSEDTMTEAGTCANEAVYFYSCAVCGDVECNPDHTFKGEKDPDNHTGGTALDGKLEADHANQIDGNTGTEICLGCEKVLVPGTVIPAGDHVAGDVWSKDETGHWKVCSIEGCGAKMEVTAHTPDHTGGATEQYAVKCTECGYVIEEQLAHVHDFQEIVGDAFLVSAADCENAAKYYVSCACGEVGEATFEHGEALGHKWVDATCETAKTCSVCEKTEGEKLGHTWVDATCTTPKTCSVCEKTEGEALGHTPNREEPTEEEAVKCTVCDEILKPALDHTHKTEKVEGKDATCTADGQKAYYVCKCGAWFADSTANVEITDKTSVVIPALGHTWVDATCETAKTCSVCNETEGDALGHKWEDATCTAPKTCPVCEKTEGEALGHKWVDATCTAPKTCSVCGETEGEALGHTPDREEATEEHPVKCTVCDEILKPVLGHTHKTEKVEGKDATCTEAGQKTYYVCKCGKWFADSTANVEIVDKASVVIAALGHDWLDATCDAPKTCDRCGETEGEKLEHKWVDATCTEPETCALCGLTQGEALGHGETEQKSDKKGHWDACVVCGKMVNEAAEPHVDEDGDEKCDVCEHVLTKPGNPQTGDSTIHLLVMAMVLSLAGCSVLFLQSKKRRA